MAVLAACCLGLPAAFADGCGDATHGCLEVDLKHPGCNDATCCTTVCALEPSCCDLAWDEICVALALKFCQACGLASTSCFTESTLPGCTSPNCCNYLCALPGFETCCTLAWDANCALAAESFCIGCGAPGAESCSKVHEAGGCESSECCIQVCAVDPVCCDIGWDNTCVQWSQQFCPSCGSPTVGNCCWPHFGPFCDDAACCESVCAVDDYCCTTSWDATCVLYANATCELPNCLCGDAGAGLCKTVHNTPGCDDFECCTNVCYSDAFCCAVAWDYACTKLTDQICETIDTCGNVGKGSCFIKHETPGCDDGACCKKVCAIDPACCDMKWDLPCVNYANIVCTACGDIQTGSCYVAHGSPACSDKTCCDAVCAGDAFCCQEEWDSLCAFLANAICPSPLSHCGSPTGRSCFVASTLPGCDDVGCCADICTNVDPFCCEVAWDAACVDMSLTYCGSIPSCPGRGSCTEVHVFPGCNDPICCSAVCELDNVCCALGWDSSCVTIARAICFGLQDCPGSKKCNISHGEPGCDDPSCCNVVCAIDPLCCIEAWDILCVQSAQSRCQPSPDSNCPCLGACLEPHGNPGCDDASCCAGVCHLDTYCCEIGWDQVCANLARGVCCGDIGCGNSCAGACFVPHDQPYCSSPSCCEAVCAIDPFCCDTKWDGACAGLAIARCTHVCGVPQSGGCFVARSTPSCADRDCCDVVCNLDPTCCETAWDDVCVSLAQGTPNSTPPHPGLCRKPKCGDFVAGKCCEAHQNPACDDFSCCHAVCTSDPFCCQSTWDANCAAEARERPECNCVSECGDPCAGSCCEVHLTPLCDDEACCTAVCKVDPFCCEAAGGAWDSICLGIVYSSAGCERACPSPDCGDPAAGDCCSAHFFANCSDKQCCNAVCAQDSFCCDTQWDFACAVLAGDVCDICQSKIFCGAPGAGSCFTQHSGPFCNDFSCCTFVCTIDDSCCTISWDQSCADFATQFCTGP